MSTDGSSQLEADIDNHFKSQAHSENIHIDFSMVDPSTSCIFLYLDGGARNFRLVNRVTVYCYKENVQKEDSDFMSHIEAGGYVTSPLCHMVHRSGAFHTAEAMACCTLYRERSRRSDQWYLRNVCEDITCETTGEKDGRCMRIALSAVPAYSKYQPRLFPNVKVICSALSSGALPGLKKHFQAGDGLDIRDFTRVLFQQLCTSYPALRDLDEAAYAVAMLQDMFGQIDFNGDGSVDWDEFTTFCIHTGLVTAPEQAEGGASSGTLENYTIEYAEDHNIKDNTLSSHTPITQLRYSQDSKRLIVLKDTAEGVMMFTEKFELQCLLNPNTLPHADVHEKIKVHDCIFLPSKDLYVYCGSDHTIVFCREHSTRKSNGIYHTVANLIHTVMLHVKLCWSEKCEILCSVSADNMIYGWDPEHTTPKFHISRHSDLVTDFIAVDELDLFVTCSLDKRVVLWSQTSRRVKGILVGHMRGVRSMSYARGVLLTAGFECEAKTWDVNLKEPTLILRGHRMPIAAAKIMCPSKEDTGDNVRALTVDESGEFRLWNVFVKEKSSDQGLAQVLQIFHLHSDEPAVTAVRFIELPFTKQYARGNYSNLIAGSTKLVHLIPEKNTAEFIPPTCMCYNEPNTCIVTAVGRNLYKYDICSGEFVSCISSVDTSEITCIKLDGAYARKVYVGCTSGRLVLLNFLTGDVLASVNAHSKQVMAIDVMRKGRRWVFTGSIDGKIRCLEDVGGTLAIHLTIENAFGDNKGVGVIKSVESLKVIVAASGGTYWGVWNTTVFRRLITIEETSSIVGIEIIGASGDDKEIADNIMHGVPLNNVRMLTVAVCTRRYIKVYTLDVSHKIIANTHYFQHEDKLDMTCFSILHFPSKGSINYNNDFNTHEAPKHLFIAGSYEGTFTCWDASNVRTWSTAVYLKLSSSYYPGQGVDSAKALLRQVGGVTSQRADDEEEADESPRSNDEEPNSVGIVDLSSVGDSLCLKDGSLTGSSQEIDDASSVFSLTNSTIEYIGTSTRKSKRFDSLMKSEANAEPIKTDNHEINVEHLVAVHSSLNSWVVHSDAVNDVAPLDEHGCVITVSIDGFHRIWNLDSECLGEMLLPNVTDKMKSKSLFSKERTCWKFFMERIPVNVSHIDVAKKLLISLDRKESADTSGHETGRRRDHANMGLLVSSGDVNGDEMLLLRKTRVTDGDFDPSVTSKPLTQKDVNRIQILRDLRKTHDSCDEDSMSSLVFNSSPVRASTGARSRRQIVDVPPDSVGTSTIPPLNIAKRVQTASPSSRKKGHGSSKKMDSHSVSMSSHRSASTLHSTSSMWSSTDEIFPLTNPAFSEHSIAAGHHEGLIDAEGHKILRRVNQNEDRREVYNRSTPKVLLRNVPLSTQLQVPSTNSVKLSEVAFGPQMVSLLNYT